MIQNKRLAVFTATSILALAIASPAFAQVKLEGVNTGFAKRDVCVNADGKIGTGNLFECATSGASSTANGITVSTGDNQTKINDNGINVSGADGTTIDKDGVKTNAVQAGSVASAGAITGASLTTSGAIAGDTVTAVGAVSGASGNFVGAVNAASGNFVGAVNAGSVASAGAITGASLTTSGAIAGDSVTAVGTVKGSTLTDGVASLNGGNLTGANNGTFSGNVQAGTLRVTGGSTFGTAGTTTIDTNGAIFVRGAGGVGGTTIDANGVKVGAGTTIIDAATGTISVNSSNATRKTTLNGTTGDVTVGGDFAVASNRNVDFGGNALHGVGPGILGTDAVNVDQLSSVARRLDKRIDTVSEGVAIALAIQNPILTGSDRFGVSVNWGEFDGNAAFGAAAAGIVGHNIFGAGEKVGLTGGFGVSGGQVAGRAGLQFTW